MSRPPLFDRNLTMSDLPDPVTGSVSSSPAPQKTTDQAKMIVLVGLMGAGKTTIGRRLASRLGLEFVDADQEIERAAGCTIAEIFARHGEPAFRDGERRVIQRLLQGPPKILATGGGAFIDLTRAGLLKRTPARSGSDARCRFWYAVCRVGPAGRCSIRAISNQPWRRFRRSVTPFMQRPISSWIAEMTLSIMARIGSWKHSMLTLSRSECPSGWSPINTRC